MVFALNLLYSLLCSYGFSRFYSVKEEGKFFIYLVWLIPVWIVWLILCGGQYYVGTDYESYYTIFETADLYIYYYKLEYLFAWIVEFIAMFHLPPQTGFYLFYFIGFVFLIGILSKLHHRTSFIFILLYITISTAFNNQLNGLRQYIALYIGTFAVMLLYGNRGVRNFLLCIFLACMIHSSSILFLPMLYFRYHPEVSYRFCLNLLVLSVIFSLVGSYDWILNNFAFLIPTQYTHYIGGDFDNPHGLSKILTKLFFVPFYYYSMDLIKEKRLYGYNLFLYKVGFIGYGIRLFFMDNIILNRIGVSFVLLSVFPLYYLLKDLYDRKENGKFLMISLFFIAFYFIKVIVFPVREYLYDSIYKFL